MTDESGAVLVFDGVSKSYYTNDDEVEALMDVSFRVKLGEFVVIIGPSGCGKSTILSMACGLISPQKGSVRVLGRDASCRDGTAGYMLQSHHLLPWRTIRENALLGPEIRSEARGLFAQARRAQLDECRARVDTLLEKYGLSAFADRYPRELSGGMKQRAALIRTLAYGPELLLLDEPFSALDAQTRLAVTDDVWHIIRNENKTAVLVTHDISEAVSSADRILVLSARPGRIIHEYRVDLEGGPNQRRQSGRFAGYFDAIWKELDVHV